MAEGFSTKYAEARMHAKKIQSIADEMENTFNNMKNIRQQLLEEHWDSASAQEVADYFQDSIEPIYAEKCQKLRDYAEAIILDTRDYEESDKREGNMVIQAQ